MPSQAAVIVFFVQGLAFFAMGISILVAVRPKSALVMARSLWLLAAFGLLHSLGSWLQLAPLLNPAGTSFGRSLDPVRGAILVLHSIALAQFGANVISGVANGYRWLRVVPAALFVWWFPSAIIAGYHGSIGGFDAAQTEAVARYVVYLPGALLSALALYAQGRALSAARLPGVERDCRLAAFAFAAYAVSGGLIVPTTLIVSTQAAEGQNLAALAELPIEIIRLVLAPLIAVFIVRTLRVFEFEHYLEVEDLNRQLRRLSRAIVTAQESERKRIARELHDETAQLLSSLLVRLKLLGTVQNADDLDNRTTELMHLASEATQSIRHMAFQLRPAALDDLGLVTALQWYVDEYVRREGLKVEFSACGLSERVDPEVELSLYRVVQECLTNIAKHAQASLASVQLRHDAGTIAVVVEDDGRGFDVAAACRPRGKGLGILGMRERMALIGGKLEIQSQPGRGTVVRVSVPLVDESGGTNGKGSGENKGDPLRRSPGDAARSGRPA